jgi:hypothetical protein
MYIYRYDACEDDEVAEGLRERERAIMREEGGERREERG